MVQLTIWIFSIFNVLAIYCRIAISVVVVNNVLCKQVVLEMTSRGVQLSKLNISKQNSFQRGKTLVVIFKPSLFIYSRDWSQNVTLNLLGICFFLKCCSEICLLNKTNYFLNVCKKRSNTQNKLYIMLLITDPVTFTSRFRYKQSALIVYIQEPVCSSTQILCPKVFWNSRQSHKSCVLVMWVHAHSAAHT